MNIKEVILETLSFHEVLLYSFLSVAFVFYVSLILRDKAGENSVKPDVRQQRRSASILVSSLFLCEIIYLVMLIFSLYNGYRPLAFYIFVGLLYGFAVIAFKVLPSKTIAPHVLTISLLVALTEPLMVTVGNRFYPVWHWERDTIFTTGKLDQYFAEIQKTGLYYLVPVTGLNIVTLARITGLPIYAPSTVMLARVIATVVLLIITFRAMKPLEHYLLAGLTAVFILVSSPGDSIISGRLVLTVYPFLFLYLTTIYINRKGSERSTITALLITMLPMIFAHGTPVLTFLLLLTPLAFSRSSRGSKGFEINRKIAEVLILLTTSALTYWLSTYILSSTISTGRKILESLLDYFTSGEITQAVATRSFQWSYSPRYYSYEFSIFGYDWAFPVGVTSALALSYLTKLIKEIKKGIPLPTLEISATLTGTLVVAFSYLAYTKSEGGQYLIPVGYFLCLLAASITIASLTNTKKVSLFIIPLILTSAFVSIGMYDPSHSPLEHPNFDAAARIFRYTNYVEAEVIETLLSPGVTVYYDYDIPVAGGIYKGIREILQRFFTSGNVEEFLRTPLTIVILKSTRISLEAVRSTVYLQDIVYVSDLHLIIAIR